MAVPPQFPTTRRTPTVGVSVILGTGGASGQAEKKTLCIGVGLAAGSKTANDIDEITSGDQADAYYGAGSSLARMVRRVIEEQKGARVWGGFLADAGGTKAQATITFAGVAGADSTYEVTINGWTVTASIPDTTDANTAAGLVNTAIQSHPMYGQMPIVSTVSLAVVTLETKEANVEATEQVTNIWQDTDNLDTQTATLDTAAQAGAGALDIDPVLSASATTWFNYIIARTTDVTNLNRLEAHCDTQSSALNAKYCEGGIGTMDTPANARTLAIGGNAFRVQVLNSPDFQEAHYETIAAWFANRQYEEAIDPTTAYKEFPLQSVKTPHLVTQYMSDADIEAALQNGVTPVACTQGGEAYIPRSLTSHSQTTLGAPDDTVLDTPNVTGPQAAAVEIRSAFSTRYNVKPGVAFKIMDDPTDGSTLPSFVVSPNLVIRDIWGFMDEWYDRRWIVNPSSPVDYKGQVAADRVGVRINAQLPWPLAQGAYLFDIALYQISG